ncbi:AlkA N-terminal domain-containing protein [Nocardioides sp. AE5]|uniref:AlkA N-terminal domain-containing protein n=1 Tax=Nocardioides sp. AE5 TaxID=2962573 RepID=UPI002881B298|nr:AlkA N-terminal domain-containing protein [Nocardioides sp. AE5]MDT0202887.1 AlkA N-terminal domain-containing protein [Nocardioides sp. AE5]
MHTDREACYQAVRSRDRRFDGVFYTAVHTTGIYCRPSCPARTPAIQNVAFHPSAAAAQAAGFRACKRCLPDATPGSPAWDVAADVAGRAMRLVNDGVVEREGVDGLAGRLGYSTRHLNRLLTEQLGAGPLALARARRARTARVLIETTRMGFADIAFASGFASVRQFNETIREVYASSPTQLRGRRGGVRAPDGHVRMRLAVRTPFAGAALLDFLAARAVPGVEHVAGTAYARTLRLPHGPGAVSLDLVDHGGSGGVAMVQATFWLTDLRDTGAAVERVRRLLDADCDPVAVDEQLGADPVLGASVARTPGLRVPGVVDGDEIAFRAVLGQQISVARARDLAGAITAQWGEQVDAPVPGLTHLFPDAATFAGLGEAAEAGELRMPRARARSLVALGAALAGGSVRLDRGTPRDDVRAALLALPGIGPWTADYVAMRALGDPDVFLPTDLVVRRATQALAGRADPRIAAEAWRPWRSYALMHLWRSGGGTEPARRSGQERQGGG